MTECFKEVYLCDFLVFLVFLVVVFLSWDKVRSIIEWEWDNFCEDIFDGLSPFIYLTLIFLAAGIGFLATLM